MKVISKIIFSGALLYLLLQGFDCIYTFGLKQNRNLKATSLSLRPKNADIVIHGPCEPLWMIDPDQLMRSTRRSFYNLALSHSDFADNYLHLYLYLKTNKAPEYLFLYITPESLDKKFNTFNTYRFSYLLHDDTIRNTIKEMDPDYYKWTVIPFMRYAYYNNRIMYDAIQGYKHYWDKREDAYFPSGFEPPAAIVWDNHLEDMQQQYPQGFVFHPDPVRIKYLEKIIVLAQQNKVKVILYESPVLKESLSSLVNREEMVGIIKNTASKYKVEFIQFDNLPLAASRQYFISSLNLNMKGLRIFNDTLASYISKLP